MANSLYDNAREYFLGTAGNWLTVDLRALLVSDKYVFDPKHVFLSDIPIADRLAMSSPLTGASATDGYAYVDNISTPPITAGEKVNAIVISSWTGADSTSRMFAYLDDALQLPLVSDGSIPYVSFDATTRSVFRI